MTDLISAARRFAIEAHERIDQRRKYTGEPYWVHPQAVARLVASVSDDATLIAAAWLHDTVEDTPVTLADIRRQFGERVAVLVSDLTDVSRPEDGNRALRKRIDRQHSARAHADAKTVKLADLIHNTESIVDHAPEFAHVYLAEKALLLEVLTEGHPQLYQRACRQLAEAKARLREP